MHRSKELIVLFTLLVAGMGFVLGYVIDRRAKNRAIASASPASHAPLPAMDTPSSAQGPLAPQAAEPLLASQPASTASLVAAAVTTPAATPVETLAVPSETIAATPAPAPQENASRTSAASTSPTTKTKPAATSSNSESSPATVVAQAETKSPLTDKSADPVDLANHDRQTLDFSNGTAVVKESPEDKAAINSALSDIAEATKHIVFKAEKAPRASSN